MKITNFIKTFKLASICFVLLFGCSLDLHSRQRRSLTRQPLTTEESAIDDLKKVAPAIINSPIWTRTSPIVSRDALYLMPLSKTILIDNPGFFVSPFFNSGKKLVTPIDTHLRFDLDTSVIDQVIEEKLISSGFTQNELLDTQDFLGFLDKLDIEERKSGMAWQLNIPWNWGFFQIDSNMWMVERNFIVPPKVEKEIRGIVSRLSGSSNLPFDEKKEFARINFGIGDIRFRLGFKLVNSYQYKFNAGLNFIIPTASGFLYDAHFQKAKSPSLHLDIDPFIKSSQNILLKGNLGNSGHYGAGIFLNQKVLLFDDRLKVHSYFSYDRFSSARISLSHLYTTKQNRFFMFKPTLFREDFEVEDTAEMRDRFFEEYVVPQQFQVSLTPGSILEFTVVLDGAIGKWNIRCGYDYYCQQHESLEKLYSSKVTLNVLEVDKALSVGYEQHKLMFEADYNFNTRQAPVNLAIGGDYSIISKGVENDWTLYARIGIPF